jgi:hypothetical protein
VYPGYIPVPLRVTCAPERTSLSIPLHGGSVRPMQRVESAEEWDAILRGRVGCV